MTIFNIKNSVEKAILDNDNKKIKVIMRDLDKELLGRTYLPFIYFDFILWCLNNHQFCSIRSSSHLIWVIYINFYKFTHNQKINLLNTIDKNINVYFLNKNLYSNIIAYLECEYQKKDFDSSNPFFLKWRNM